MENAKDARIKKWTDNVSFRCELGNGKMTLFWEDNWCRSRPLKGEFSRLFQLEKFKASKVEMYTKNNGFIEVIWEEIFVRQRGRCLRD